MKDERRHWGSGTGLKCFCWGRDGMGEEWNCLCGKSTLEYHHLDDEGAFSDGCDSGDCFRGGLRLLLLSR